MSHKTLAFGDKCYRKGTSGDVVAEDGEGVSGSQALSLRVAEDAALVRAAASEPVASPRFIAYTLGRDRDRQGVVHEVSVIDPRCVPEDVRLTLPRCEEM